MYCTVLQSEDGGTGLYQTWYRCAQSYEHHSSNRVFETDGAAEMRRQVTDDRRQHADDGDRDDEAGPAVPVVGGRNESKQNLPEDSEEVHDIVKTGRQLFLATFIVIIITWAGEGGSTDSFLKLGQVNLETFSSVNNGACFLCHTFTCSHLY